jgi:sulfopyruvate decarboxylase subunit alpha
LAPEPAVSADAIASLVIGAPPIDRVGAARAHVIAEHLRAAGVSVVASLPDQWTGDLIRVLESRSDILHVRVAREDDGVGLCAGASLGGRRAALVCQNAGLLLSGNALAGYAHSHQLPFLVLCAWRGGADDAYFYQAYKGRTTLGVLDGLQLPYHRVERGEQLGLIEDGYRQATLWRTPVVLLLARRVLSGEE